MTAISNSGWGEISTAIRNSREALEAVWNQDAVKVAEAVERAHYETSHLQYNDENALSYTVSLAFYAARNFYTVFRELPGGKGFADLVFLPKKQYAHRPALLIELKWNQDVDGAIRQIKEKNTAVRWKITKEICCL